MYGSCFATRSLKEIGGLRLVLTRRSWQMLGGWRKATVGTGEQIAGKGVGQENLVASPSGVFQNIETRMIKGD